MYASVHSCIIYNSQDMLGSNLNVHEQMNGLKMTGYIYIMEYYSDIKKE